jgi:uncharacterized protein YegP (UPF0339 family)
MNKFDINKFVNETEKDPEYFLALGNFVKEWEENSVNGKIISILCSSIYRAAKAEYNYRRKQHNLPTINNDQVYSSKHGAVHYIPINKIPQGKNVNNKKL